MGHKCMSFHGTTTMLAQINNNQAQTLFHDFAREFFIYLFIFE